MQDHLKARSTALSMAAVRSVPMSLKGPTDLRMREHTHANHWQAVIQGYGTLHPPGHSLDRMKDLIDNLPSESYRNSLETANLDTFPRWRWGKVNHVLDCSPIPDGIVFVQHSTEVKIILQWVGFKRSDPTVGEIYVPVVLTMPV